MGFIGKVEKGLGGWLVRVVGGDLGRKVGGIVYMGGFVELYFAGLEE